MIAWQRWSQGRIRISRRASHAGTEITVWRHLLSSALSVAHDGKLVTLAPVDLARNAVSRRVVPSAPAPDDDEGAPRTAAQIAFARDFAPVVGPDGGFRYSGYCLGRALEAVAQSSRYSGHVSDALK